MKHPKRSAYFAIALALLTLGFSQHSKAESSKLFIADNKLNYQCPDGIINPPANLGIDLGSVRILNDSYFIDKNKTYVVTEDWHSHFCSFNIIPNADPSTFKAFNDMFQKDKNNVYSNTNYWGWGVPSIIKKVNTDAASFLALAGKYAKDKNNAYYFTFKNNGTVEIVAGADPVTFEVFQEDNEYAMDKNNMYFQGQMLTKQKLKVTNSSLYSSLRGRIILKSEGKGEAYYVNPSSKEAYSLSRPVTAFRVMREQGVGITNANLIKIPVGGSCPSYDPACNVATDTDARFASSQKGRILLQIEGNGEAWYVNPKDAKRYFLGRPADAFTIMKTLGLGISNADFDRLTR
jgi:hypothetical protein